MLRIIITVSLLAIGGAILGQWIAQEPGYILISFRDTSLETTLWVGILLFIGAVAVFWLIYAILKFGLLLPNRIRYGLLNRKGTQARNQIRRALVRLISGNYSSIVESSKSMFSDNNSIEMMLINAEAFLKNKNYDKLVEICRQIEDSANKEATAGLAKNQIDKVAAILMARAFKEQGKHARALKLLQPYINDAKSEQFMLGVLLDIYVQDKRWQDLGNLLSKLSHQQLQDNSSYIVKFFTNASDLGSTNNLWSALDSSIKSSPEVAAVYATALGRNNKESDALEFLQSQMNKKYNGILANAYKNIRSNTPLQQLKFLEDFVKSHPADKALLAALAQLSLHNRMQAKARSYYEQLLQNNPEAALEDRVNYAKILEESNNSSDKQKAYEVLLSGFNNK